MRTFTWRMCMLAAGAALGLIAACESTQERSAPGALPTRRPDVMPQVNASTYVAHGHLLERQGKYEAAAVQYEKALELTPNLLMARNRLGVTLNRLGRHAEASEQFRRALARQPGLAYLHNNLGFSLYMEGRYAEAEPELARALEVSPTFPRARMNHGLALGKLGRFDEALAEFALAGNEADAYYNLSLVQADAGRYADAARSLEQALSADPGFDPARQQLREVSRLAAEQEAAERAAAELAVAKRAAEAEAVAAVAEPAVPAADEPANADVQPAANVEIVPTPPAESLDQTDDATPEESARLFEQIWALLAMTEQPAEQPAEAVPQGTLETGAWTKMFNELIDGLLTNAPWWQGCLDGIRQVLGLSGPASPPPTAEPMLFDSVGPWY